MGLNKLSWMVLRFLVVTVLSFEVFCINSDVAVKFLKAPRAFSRLNSATFVFQVFVGGNGTCKDCSISCKLDNGIASDCGVRKVLYTGLQDGNHTFDVCTNGSQGIGCDSYSWTVDTVPPTANVTAWTPFTNALNVSVTISFSEPCTGEGGFGCSSVNACNLLVYGAGQVIPSSLIILQQNLKYTILVGLSSLVQYGRLILVMDKNFCTDSAGNRFARTGNSISYVHFDRRSVSVNLRIHIPEKLLQLNSINRTVRATNDYSKLKVYLYFSEPILNSSAEILNSFNTNHGTLLPIGGNNFGNRRYGFTVADISSFAIVTVNLDSSSIISRQGTHVSPVSPVTFLYDNQRPAVTLSATSSMRTREHIIPISIKFTKPVFGFNSSLISISGGLLKRFHEISRSICIAEIQADDEVILVIVPENVTGDVAGNKNLPSNVLQVRHNSVSMVSSVISTFTTAAFLVTSFTAGLLSVSTASLQSVGSFSSPCAPLTYDSTRILFRSACHMQVFALSRWLTVALPVEYYEFVRGLQWSIPYFSLPWEKGHIRPVMVGLNPPTSSHFFKSKNYGKGIFQSVQPEDDILNMAASLYGLPLTPMEYSTYFESQDIKPKAEYVVDHHSNGWRNFKRSMFWLAVIGGGLMVLHALFLFILKFRKKNSEKQKSDYGEFTFPRFEIYLVVLALPCISQASASLIIGGVMSGVILGILLLSVVSFLLLALFLFLSIGITLGKLLQYKEVHQEGQEFHWYQDLIRVTLGPGKRGQWTWKKQPDSVYPTMFGPLFEDLRGPPKYMLSQFSWGTPPKPRERIISSDDETEDAEAPFIQKLFGILRIYYTLLESVKRVSLGILAGAYSNNCSARTPIVILLCITAFQLFFLILKKPFIKKKVQLVEIISVSCEVALFAICFVLLEKEFSSRDRSEIGTLMIVLFLVGFLAQIINGWYALYNQTKWLDSAANSFLKGMKVAFIGFLMILVPQKSVKNWESKFSLKPTGSGEDTTPSSHRNRRSDSRSSTDKPSLKQLREMAKAGFSKDGSGVSNDPSSSGTKWSGIWGTEKSGTSFVDSPSDYKSKSRGLYRDLEAIFASK
ncbi:hypothetical protein CFOL_v3_01884 [Cephalotus follicularis]|uniref:Bacterial Ig-like domain-containing protein n=1 Tax=Cephalotus follicularis TaxID=3775 RepID=A0A1Q3ART3_CEPFO|nr:hypothetical protein CFOL_v3_01884 [Cephalotus follicularis]